MSGLAEFYINSVYWQLNSGGRCGFSSSGNASSDDITVIWAKGFISTVLWRKKGHLHFQNENKGLFSFVDMK